MNTSSNPAGTTASEMRTRRAARSVEYRKQQDNLKPIREIAEAIIMFRTRAGITQEELARRVGTSKSAIARLESGQHKPGVESLRRIAEALGMKLVIKFEDFPRTAVRSPLPQAP